MVHAEWCGVYSSLLLCGILSSWISCDHFYRAPHILRPLSQFRVHESIVPHPSLVKVPSLSGVIWASLLGISTCGRVRYVSG